MVTQMEEQNDQGVALRLVEDGDLRVKEGFIIAGRGSAIAQFRGLRALQHPAGDFGKFRD
jgi:hypothetical protein